MDPPGTHISFVTVITWDSLGEDDVIFLHFFSLGSFAKKERKKRVQTCGKRKDIITGPGKISAQPHTIVKQIRFPNGNVLFLSLFSLSKN